MQVDHVFCRIKNEGKLKINFAPPRTLPIIYKT